jgi:hypothetical protein
MPYISIDVNLKNFCDEDLLEECEGRGILPVLEDNTNLRLINSIADALMYSNTKDVILLLENEIYKYTGRIITLKES